MRAVLATSFPEKFVQRHVLPELSRRVDVVLVVDPGKAATIDLRAYAPDVVLHMVEFGGHSASEKLSAACRRDGITIRALSRKKASWSFLPKPRPEVPEPPRSRPEEKPRPEEKKPMNQPANPPSRPVVNGGSRATLADTPAGAVLQQAKEKLSPPPSPPAPASKPAPPPDELPALAELAAALRFHGQAVQELALAIRAMPAPVVSGPVTISARAPRPEPKKDPVWTATEEKALEVIGRLPGLGVSSLFVMITDGAGGEPVKTDKKILNAVLSKLAATKKVRRSGIGGKNDPYRYFPLEGG